ncbi:MULTISPECIES: MlaD family protein [Prochlorococcus]|uniref:ABC-type transport system involved in resistance to organic solvents periplasmic component n=1 Tax=Prochlorococcus marinus (strain SARG / CCMP1375 / SS120) TaxID=167539 RepID=Q7VDP8_PROMA|nr:MULTISPECIES: MlaD family protein [Prochlorococcus]AAP99366.1 ABC-type transport system involved in resistance to organic solvents periplasmic component [Prochlorococcus marinus subsp. marinus str. CCMP1375]KGG11363.1 putative ABC transporter precursor [Prochlorococcus marinus str. LG]KGG18682.1 putative ABC transporter precursor [Prochlorococcus marinus str. SS2]KGG22955.1 putative ABC transporter precursor [Prochlorococcus marinus str. SS35]KGG34059.1 putative ABC transporter precursor [P
MRRSFRDAIVGFSLIGGVVIFSGLTLWLKGLKISSNTWTVFANFADASGLSEGTPVTFRGIQIGSVKKIIFTSKDVRAKIRINSNNVILFKPVYAKIETSSLLGGDAEVSMISQGDPIEGISSNPKQENCPKDLILCAGDSIKGNDLENLSKLTGEINKFLNEAENEEIISKIVNSIEQFDSTQENLDELIRLSKLELFKARPIIDELKKTVAHINNILGSIDDPEILSDIKSSSSSIKSFTAKLDKISGKVDEIINDEELTNGIKEAAIGIGKLFNDIYE